MELYKIVFAEFERFENEEGFSSYSFGTTNRLYKSKKECVNAIQNEFSYIRKNYGIEEVLMRNSQEFKVRCLSKNNRKEMIHHYKIINFDSDGK